MCWILSYFQEFSRVHVRVRIFQVPKIWIFMVQMSKNPLLFEKLPCSALVERGHYSIFHLLSQYHNHIPGVLRNRWIKGIVQGLGSMFHNSWTFPARKSRSSVNPFSFSCCNFHNLTRTYKGRLLYTPTRFLKISTINHFVKMNGSTYCSLWCGRILQTATTLHSLYSWQWKRRRGKNRW